MVTSCQHLYCKEGVGAPQHAEWTCSGSLTACLPQALSALNKLWRATQPARSARASSPKGEQESGVVAWNLRCDSC